MLRSKSHNVKRPEWLKQWRLIGSAIFLVMLATGCTAIPISFTPTSENLFNNRAEAPPITPPQKQLKLGLLVSLSGNLRRYGGTMQDSARLLVDTANGCNGVVGQAVHLLVEDDQSTVAAGKAGALRLLETDRVGAIIGAIGSEISNATVDIAAQKQVVQISPASASSTLTQRAQKGAFKGFWFRTMPPDTSQGEALAQLAHKRGFKSVSILTIDNAYGNSIAQSFTSRFKQLKGTVIQPVYRYSPYASLYGVDLASAFSGSFDPSQPDLQPPDAVLIVAEPYLGSEMLKTAYESGLWRGSTKVLLTSSMRTDNLAGRVGQSNDGRYIASGVLGISPSTQNTAANAFTELYKNTFDRNPGLYDANTWDAAALTILAAEAAQATSGNAIKAELPKVANPPGVAVSDVCRALTLVREGKDIDYQGASGKVNFKSSGDVIGNYDVWTVDYTGTIKVEETVQSDLN